MSVNLDKSASLAATGLGGLAGGYAGFRILPKFALLSRPIAEAFATAALGLGTHGPRDFRIVCATMIGSALIGAAGGAKAADAVASRIVQSSQQSH